MAPKEAQRGRERNQSPAGCVRMSCASTAQSTRPLKRTTTPEGDSSTHVEDGAAGSAAVMCRGMKSAGRYSVSGGVAVCGDKASRRRFYLSQSFNLEYARPLCLQSANCESLLVT